MRFYLHRLNSVSYGSVNALMMVHLGKNITWCHWAFVLLELECAEGFSGAGRGDVEHYQKFREKLKINEDVSLEIYGF